jgi:hypothetical protein
MQAACPDHLILLDCIAIIIFREQCSFLQSLFTSSLLGPEILQSTRFSNILNLTTWQYIPEDSKLHPQLTEVSDYHDGEFEDDSLVVHSAVMEAVYCSTQKKKFHSHYVYRSY